MKTLFKALTLLSLILALPVQVQANPFERMVARHPYLVIFTTAGISAAIGIFAYSKISKKPDAKSLFTTAAVLGVVGTGAAIATFGMPTFAPAVRDYYNENAA